MADKEPKAWITVNGKHIPIFDDEEKQRSNPEEDRKYQKRFSGSNDQLTAKVVKFMPLGKWDGTYAVHFFALGAPDYDYRGNDGMAMKVYATEQKAIGAAKRYVKRWEK